MTTQEIKSEIQKALNKVPDNALQDVLIILQMMENSNDPSVLARNLREVLVEDRELLERLAK